MADPNRDKRKQYAHYALHCLKIAPAIPDHAERAIHREMAAEWLRLADANRPPRGGQMQMG
jgi:hypothetical protein